MSEPDPDKRVVTLDLWLTLIAEQDGSQRSARRFEARAAYTRGILANRGFEVPQDALLNANVSISEMVNSDHDLGIDLPYRERVIQMLSLVDPELPSLLGDEGVDEVAASVDRTYLENPPNFLPGSKDVVRHLAELDIAVVLISNTGLTSASAYREWFRLEGVAEHFDDLVFSNEVACAKPNPGIFFPVLERINVAPENGIHIGDNLLTDVCGAAGVGMKTGWISGHDSRDPIVQPDYTLDSIRDLPRVVDAWLGTGARTRE